MNKIYKICIVIPYFGKWPEWINYFLLSCKYNQTVDWQFFTDCGLPDVVSNNLIFHQMKLSEFNNLASTQLGFELFIQNPYKICDLKPAYGIIFQEYLKGYDFWGYGDIDLIYGNVRSFITNILLDKYDIISNHHEFVAGHFCLMRNSQKINQLYMRGGYYKKAFLQSKYVGFDEQILNLKISANPRYLKLSKKINLNYHLLLNHIVKSPIKKAIRPIWIKMQKNRIQSLHDFTSIVFASQKNKEINASFKTSFQSDLMFKKQAIRNWKIIWNNGILTNQDTFGNFLYFHFILSKSSKKFSINDFHNSIKSFSITADGISIIES